MTNDLEDGFYWIFFQDDDPEVIEIIGGDMYRCGSDVSCLFKDGQWREFDEPMDILSIVGPLIPPGIMK